MSKLLFPCALRPSLFRPSLLFFVRSRLSSLSSWCSSSSQLRETGWTHLVQLLPHPTKNHCWSRIWQVHYPYLNFIKKRLEWNRLAGPTMVCIATAILREFDVFTKTEKKRSQRIGLKKNNESNSSGSNSLTGLFMSNHKEFLWWCKSVNLSRSGHSNKNLCILSIWRSLDDMNSNEE